MSTDNRQPTTDNSPLPTPPLNPPFEMGEGGKTAERQRQLILAFVLLGLAARAIRYLLSFPLWEDECFVSVNLLDRGFADLLRPLDYHQVAPPLFLWLQLAVVRLLGFTELSLRLVPFISGIASLALFVHLSRRLTAGWPRVVAVGIFSVAYAGIRYSAEAKPYGCDLLVSLVLTTLAVEWFHSGGRRWLIALAALAPVCMGLSYPAVFVAAGASLAIAYRMKEVGSRRDWIGWLAFNVCVLGAFVGWYSVSIQTQSAAELGFMSGYWKSDFPPVASPLKLPSWLLAAHTGDLLAFPVGGAHGASTLTLICCVVGIVQFRRWAGARCASWSHPTAPRVSASTSPSPRDPASPSSSPRVSASAPPSPRVRPIPGPRSTLRQAQDYAVPGPGASSPRVSASPRPRVMVETSPSLRAVLCLLLAPLGFNLLAAALHRYPYGGHVKLAMYAAPTICLLAGAGAAAVVERLGRRSRAVSPRLALIGFLVLIAVGSIARDFAHPYKTRSDMWARDFARWFWFHADFEGGVACLKTDLGQCFSPRTYRELSWSAMYLCNQAIYRPTGTDALVPGDGQFSRERPLRCVEYRVPEYPYDHEAQRRWLTHMAERFDLIGRDTYPLPRYAKGDRKLVTVDYLDVYKFESKTSYGASNGGIARLPGN